jgi:hypothetical protein
VNKLQKTENQFSYSKHIVNTNKLEIECPLKYSTPEISQNCTQTKCAWFMPIQRACAINVMAREKNTLKSKF